MLDSVFALMMPFKMPIAAGTGLTPRALNYLAGIKEEHLSYAEYGVGHPGAVFNRQCSALARDLLQLASDICKFHPSDASTGILERYRTLLLDLESYMEAPDEILIGVCRSGHPSPGPKEFYHRWLRSNRYKAGKVFHDIVKGDAKFFSELFNQKKHTSRGTRSVVFSNYGRCVLGYCLETTGIDGAIVRDENFHRTYDSKAAGNSFNRDLRRIHYLIYSVSEALIRSLEYHLRSVYNVPLSPNENEVEKDTLYRDLLTQIQQLPELYLPNEAKCLVPYAALRSAGGAALLEFTLRPAGQSFFGITEVQDRTRGDGFSTKFNFGPY